MSRPVLASRGMKAWWVEGGVVVLAGKDCLGLATRTAERFTAASTELGLEVAEWDFATLQDP